MEGTVAEEGSYVPGAENLATVAMHVTMKRNALTAPVAAQPSARNAQSGYWKIQHIEAEARRIAVAESEGRTVQGRRTAAAVVASSNSSTRPAAHSTRSVAIQTDLTWPDEQDALTTAAIQTSNSSSPTVGRGGGTTRGGSAGGRKPSEQPVAKATTSGGFAKPQGRPPHNAHKDQKPKIRRPPGSDTDENRYQCLAMEGISDSASDTDSVFDAT